MLDLYLRRSRAQKPVPSNPQTLPPAHLGPIGNPNHPNQLPLNSGHSLESTAVAERLADYRYKVISYCEGKKLIDAL